MKEFESVAQRMVNAQEDFVSMLSDLYPLSNDEARTAFSTYKKNRLLKYEAGIGRYTVLHGAFLDLEVVLRAAGVAE